MERNQLMKLFEVNGLNDYQLKDTLDFLKVFGIKTEEIMGYNTLDEEKKSLFKKFILNFYNFKGIDSKAEILPESIYYVRETQTSVKYPEDDYRTHSGTKVEILDEQGIVLKTLFEREDENHRDMEKIADEPKEYLRFTYSIIRSEEKTIKEWLHVLSDTQWY